MSKGQTISYNLFTSDHDALIKSLGGEKLRETLRKMYRIRHFETRAESAYQQGKIGGFFHSYIGQEAIQTSCVDLLGLKPWYATTYRCHALALLTGVDVKDAMSELYGKANGNAKGRGGSMHLYSDKLLGGFGIVGGHVPIAVGAAFSLKYKKEKNLSLCFLGDGAVVQGAVHESLNLASLWNLPCIIVIENNQWGMGTAVSRAVCHQPIAESFAKAYGINSYSVNGMDYFDCYGCFEKASKEVIESSRPILIEALTERFKGHSVSDPGLYRSKDVLKEAMERDPIAKFVRILVENKIISEDECKAISDEEKEKVIAAMKHADESPWPDLATLEDGVYFDEGQN